MLTSVTTCPNPALLILKPNGITLARRVYKCVFVCSFSVLVTVDNKPVQLQLCDTAGQVSNTSFSHQNVRK